MARKKDATEEEWFDDDEQANEKPAKKKGKKGKKTLKIVAWIVAFALILGILLFIRFKYAGPTETQADVTEEVPPADVVEEQYVTEPDKATPAEATDEGTPYEEPKYLGPDVVAKESLEHIEPNIDTSAEPVLFSNLRCDYDSTADVLFASLRIYNILDTELAIAPHGVQKGYNTYFFIRGVVDTDPGCGTELLKAKEFTDCKRIGFDLPRYSLAPGINRISVQVPGKTEALLIECPAVPEESALNQWFNKAGGASPKTN